MLIDAMSRRILAVYLTFDEPSYRSCMMVLRICVQRFSRFPETIVVDGGAEFGSTYFETLLAAFECTKKQRPIAKARFGSVIERIFGTTNTEFFYNLRGNTQITKNVRVVTKSNQPKGQAVWTLDELYEQFCTYCYELLNCATLNGQMGRRSEDIHLSPYWTDDPSDVAEFIRVISTFQRHLPLPKEPNFEQHYEYLLQGSVGCVGILKNWLTRSLRLALADSAPTLTTSHLKQGAFSPSRINKIRAEAQQGERRFLEENSLSFQLESSSNNNHHSVNKLSSKKVRVGQRSPKRDTVGMGQYDN